MLEIKRFLLLLVQEVEMLSFYKQVRTEHEQRIKLLDEMKVLVEVKTGNKTK